MMSADHHYVPVALPVSVRSRTEAFHRAVVAAGHAPSVHNRQPWKWSLAYDGLDLLAESSRMEGIEDPDGRLVAISCGAALHHAWVALAAQGWRVTVTRQPDGPASGHLARLHIDAVAGIGRSAARAAEAIGRRHTDTRPVTGEPLDQPDLDAIRSAAESAHVRLHVLRPDEVLSLVAATAGSPGRGPVEAQWYDELARWAGQSRIVGADDDTRLPRPPGAHDRAATFVVLYGPTDERLDWLRAGEALSAAWLVATGLRVSVLPFSAPIEGVDAGAALRRTLGDLGHPYLVMRLGRHAGVSAAPLSPPRPNPTPGLA
jgi:hypothetical protein